MKVKKIHWLMCPICGEAKAQVNDISFSAIKHEMYIEVLCTRCGLYPEIYAKIVD